MTSPEHFISLINISSAKKLAAAIVACFILYHGIIHIIYGKYFAFFVIETINFLLVLLQNICC